MRVLHIISGLSPSSGGSTTAVLGLTRALARHGLEVLLFTTAAQTERIEGSLNGIKVETFPTRFPRRWHYSPELRQALIQVISQVDIVHTHDIWLYPELIAAWLAKGFKVPYVITPHGELDSWAINHKRLKKKIHAALIGRRILKGAAALHALCPAEAEAIRAFGLENPLIVIPNGVEASEFHDLPDHEEITKHYPDLHGKKRLLFLGRIHPKKGLGILAQAFGEVTRKHSHVYLIIAGPDEGGYQAKVEAMFRREGVLDKVLFTGMLQGYQKLVVLAGADLFILPSYSEGFAVAILEAMMCKLPVIITKNCNFPEIAEASAGEIIDPDPGQLAATILKLLDDPQLRRAMGSNGRRLVHERFLWDQVAASMINAYQWLLTKGV